MIDHRNLLKGHHIVADHDAKAWHVVNYKGDKVKTISGLPDLSDHWATLSSTPKKKKVARKMARKA